MTENIEYGHNSLPEVMELLGFVEVEPGLWQKPCDELTDQNIDFRTKKNGNSKGRRYVEIRELNKDSVWITKTDELEKYIPLLRYKTKRDELMKNTAKQNSVGEKNINKNIEPNRRFNTTAPTEIVPSAAPPQLTRGGSGFLTAATTIDEAVTAFNLYEDAKTKILKDTDILYIAENGLPATNKKGKPYIKKSGWRKLGRFFGLSTEILQKEKTWTEDAAGKKYYIWTYQIKVSHPCGAFVISEGICTNHDKFFTKGGQKEAEENNVMLKAQTVGINRGISDLLGSGDVSAEEMGGSA